MFSIIRVALFWGCDNQLESIFITWGCDNQLESKATGYNPTPAFKYYVWSYCGAWELPVDTLVVNGNGPTVCQY
jgi:hypothetical protein